MEISAFVLFDSIVPNEEREVLTVKSEKPMSKTEKACGIDFGTSEIAVDRKSVV